MALATDAIITKDESFGGTAHLNASWGGQGGHHIRIGAETNIGVIQEILNSQAHVIKSVIPIMISYPRFFDYLENGKLLAANFKSIMETHTMSISGLRAGLSVSTQEHKAGHAGEMLEEVINVTRERSQVSHTFIDKLGRPIQKLLDVYIRYGQADPDTKAAIIGQYLTDEDTNGLYTADFSTFTMLYIRPDALFKHADYAWLGTNMFPKGNGAIDGERNEDMSGKLVDLNIEFTGVYSSSEAVRRFAEQVLNNLSILNKHPDTNIIPSHSDIDPNTRAINTGYDRK